MLKLRVSPASRPGAQISPRPRWKTHAAVQNAKSTNAIVKHVDTSLIILSVTG